MATSKLKAIFRLIRFKKPNHIQLLIEPRLTLIDAATGEPQCLGNEPAPLACASVGAFLEKCDLLYEAACLPVLDFDAYLVNANNESLMQMAEESDIERDRRAN